MHPDDGYHDYNSYKKPEDLEDKLRKATCKEVIAANCDDVTVTSTSKTSIYNIDIVVGESKIVISKDQMLSLSAAITTMLDSMDTM